LCESYNYSTQYAWKCAKEEAGITFGEFAGQQTHGFALRYPVWKVRWNGGEKVRRRETGHCCRTWCSPQDIELHSQHPPLDSIASILSTYEPLDIWTQEMQQWSCTHNRTCLNRVLNLTWTCSLTLCPQVIQGWVFNYTQGHRHTHRRHRLSNL